MLNRARAIQVSIGSALLAACALPVHAETGWSVDAGVSHTDNATLTDVDPQEDTLASVGGAIAYEQKTNRLEASLTGHGNYVHYTDDTFDDDFQSYARGELIVGIVPERFLWTVEDTFGQIAINQFEPVTPDNRQNLNTFSTGPDFIVRLGTQSDIELSGRYRDTQYEESKQVDSQEVQGSIAFRRHISESTSWELVASDSRIEYDAPGDPEYDQSELYASWQSRENRQTLTIDVGANRVDSDAGNFTKPLLRVDWSRRVAPSWTLGVGLRSEYQNTGDQFVSQNLDSSIGTADIGISQAPAASYDGSVSLEFDRARTRFGFEAGYSKLDYVVDNGLNEESSHGMLSLTRKHTPQLEGFVSYRIEKHDYENSLLSDLRQRIGVGLDWRVGRKIFLTGGYQYSDVDSDSPTNRYDASLFFITLSYRQGELTELNSFTY
jgi:hypothetical protein